MPVAADRPIIATQFFQYLDYVDDDFVEEAYDLLQSLFHLRKPCIDISQDVAQTIQAHAFYRKPHHLKLLLAAFVCTKP